MKRIHLILIASIAVIITVLLITQLQPKEEVASKKTVVADVEATKMKETDSTKKDTFSAEPTKKKDTESSKKKETFIAEPQPNTVNKVVKVFDALLNRNPTPEEIQKYSVLENDHDIFVRVMEDNKTESKKSSGKLQKIESFETSEKVERADEINKVEKKMSKLPTKIVAKRESRERFVDDNGFEDDGVEDDGIKDDGTVDHMIADDGIEDTAPDRIPTPPRHRGTITFPPRNIAPTTIAPQSRRPYTSWPNDTTAAQRQPRSPVTRHARERNDEMGVVPISNNYAYNRSEVIRRLSNMTDDLTFFASLVSQSNPEEVY